MKNRLIPQFCRLMTTPHFCKFKTTPQSRRLGTTPQSLRLGTTPSSKARTLPSTRFLSSPEGHDIGHRPRSSARCHRCCSFSFFTSSSLVLGSTQPVGTGTLSWEAKREADRFLYLLPAPRSRTHASTST
jgi:hypothetical protein